jgi:hypothetical protein
LRAVADDFHLARLLTTRYLFMFFAGQTSWRDKEPGSFACALDETP